MADISIFSPNGTDNYNLKDSNARNIITPDFSTSTSYAVGDYCIYNNALYKCTTAHSGAWSAGDFTSINVMNEVKNSGGGGGGGDSYTKAETDALLSVKADKDYVQSKTVKNHLPHPYYELLANQVNIYSGSNPNYTVRICDSKYIDIFGGNGLYEKGRLLIIDEAYSSDADNLDIALTDKMDLYDTPYINLIGKKFCISSNGKSSAATYQYATVAIKILSSDGTEVDRIDPDQSGTITIPSYGNRPSSIIPELDPYYAVFILTIVPHDYTPPGQYELDHWRDCYPMICDADSDLTTWSPYAKTNEELTGYCTKQYVAFSHDENNLTQTRELIFPVRGNSIGLGMLTLSGVVEVYGRVGQAIPKIKKRVNVFGKFTMYEDGTFGESYNIYLSSRALMQTTDSYSPDSTFFSTPMFGCCAPSKGGTSSQPTPSAEFIVAGFHTGTGANMPVDLSNLSIIDALIKITHNKNKFTVQLLDNSQYNSGGTGDCFIYRAMLELDAVFM